jgi:mannose-1-phosphate guanylyltransferase
MLVLPADHFIADPEEFRKTVKAAAITASTGEWVITFGSKPSRPETGYGYIQPGELFEICDGVKFYKVNSFHEKPDFNTAVNYLMEGNYLWNSGIFMWRIDLILALIKKYLPELSRGLDIIADSYQFDYEVKAIKDIYEKLPRVSIDYGIMEKCRQVLAIPADFGWDDIGSWEVLSRYLDADSKGNVLVGKGVLVDTENCLIYAPHKLIATLGVEDLLIAECGDNLLICKKNKSQQIKEVVKALKEAGFENKI